MHFERYDLYNAYVFLDGVQRNELCYEADNVAGWVVLDIGGKRKKFYGRVTIILKVD